MIESAIDALLQKLRHRRLWTNKANMYSEAVKAKFYQARWSLDVLREIEHFPNEEGDITSSDVFSRKSIDEKVVFFCECFWDFLRSSIDILAQLVNELRLSGQIDETEVSFWKVFNTIESTPTLSATPLFKALRSCKRSWAFKELNLYRRCSTHRRQVCIFGLPVINPQPLGRVYEYMSTSTTTINRYLCSNPSSLHPRSSMKRPLVARNEQILKEIEKRLSTIVNRLP